MPSIWCLECRSCVNWDLEEAVLKETGSLSRTTACAIQTITTPRREPSNGNTVDEFNI